MRGQFGQGGGNGLGAALALLQGLAFLGQAGLLAVFGGDAGQLLHGVAEPVAVALGGGDGGARGGQGSVGLAQGAPTGGDLDA